MELDKLNYQPILFYVLVISWGTGILILLLQKSVLEPYFNKKKLRKLDSQ